MENRTLENEYVQQREFDIYIQNIKERADSDKELTAARFDRFEAVIERKISEVKNDVDSLSTAVAGVIDRLDDMKDYQNKWFTMFGILFGALTVAFAVIAFFK